MGTRLNSMSAGVLVALMLVASAGCSSGRVGSSDGARSSGTVGQAAPGVPAPGARAAGNAPATNGGAVQNSAGGGADRLVIKNAAMQLRVGDLAATIASLSALTQTAGGSVSQLTVSSDPQSPPPDTAHPASATTRIPGPASASLTLRLPAERLAGIQASVGALGEVISQSSNESDVTQQHIDMSARLTNLRAEEARLRGFLARAGNVSDLLAVERELSRVRGDIESMQAQLAYLEGQAAMATLVISLDQPGPIVRPSTGGWGLVDSVTTGIQAAAALVRELITGALAISPLIVLGALAWWLLARRARRHRMLRDTRPPQAGTSPGTPVHNGAPSSEPPAGKLL